MSHCSRARGSGRVEYKTAPSLPLLSCESSVSVKENTDKKIDIEVHWAITNY